MCVAELQTLLCLSHHDRMTHVHLELVIDASESQVAVERGHWSLDGGRARRTPGRLTDGQGRRGESQPGDQLTHLYRLIRCHNNHYVIVIV